MIIILVNLLWKLSPLTPQDPTPQPHTLHILYNPLYMWYRGRIITKSWRFLSLVKKQQTTQWSDQTKGYNRDSKPSVPLAILISNAVRIKAIRVELKWTVLSSATGRSIRSSLCEKANQGEWWENWEVSGAYVEPPGDGEEGRQVCGRKGSKERGEGEGSDTEGAVNSIYSRCWLFVRL